MDMPMEWDENHNLEWEWSEELQDYALVVVEK